MSHARRTTIRADNLEAWRAELLLVLAPAGGCSLILSWLVLRLDGHLEYTAQFEYFLVLGSCLALAGPILGRFPRNGTWPFFLALLLPAGHAILALGWAPGVVAMLVFLTTFAGILLGRVASCVVGVMASLMFCLGGAVAGGSVSFFGLEPLAAVPPAFDIRIFSNWVRVTLVFSCFTAASGWGIGRLFQLLERSAAYYTDRVALFHERHALLSAARRERSQKTAHLQDAQRFQMITQLGHGFNELFGETLSFVRNAVEAARSADTAQRVRLGDEIIRAVQTTASRSQDVMALLRPHLQSTDHLDLARTVANIVYRFRARLRPEVSVELDVQQVEPTGVGEAWLQQVLLNLLLNAERALQSRTGRISVQVRRLNLARPYPSTCGTLLPGPYAVIRVQDNGPGISRATMARAFEPFYTEWGTSHLGVGLSTVFEMSRKAGGTVEIERPEQGASVAVYVPLVEAPSEGAPSSRLPLLSPPSFEWRDRSLRFAAKASATCTSVAMAATEIQYWVMNGGMRVHLTIGLPLLLTYAVVAQSRATYLRRLTLFVVSVCAASLIFILNVGFMAPAGIAGLSLAVMFSWALGSRSISVICLTTAALGLLGIGGLHAMGYVDTPLRQTSLAAPGNWYRVAVTLPSIVFIGTAGVLSLASAARANISQLITLLETLAATEQQLLAETQGVSGIDRVTARTSELESLSRMTGAVAHDVNNSLQAVTAWASTLTAREQLSPEDVLEALTAIDSAVSHAEVLLAELDVDGRARKEKTVVDLAAETKRSERLLRALLSEKHTLVLEAASPALVVTSPHAYQRALFNLVANARDAMPQPGQCRVRIDADAGVVRVVIEDEGQGMDEATRARLFDPYFTTKHTTGHGLGLFSVTALASDTSGSIRAWSEPGKGTRITLAFPRAS